ncbi:MAG: hypothetical protein LBK63_09015 [Treponema sp.]|nr:hypothetical protein [Treponema sp.]
MKLAKVKEKKMANKTRSLIMKRINVVFCAVAAVSALALVACDNGTTGKALALALAARDDGIGGSGSDPDFYGVWKLDASNYFHISASELSLGNEAGTTIAWTVGINRWKAVANNGENTDIDATDYPSGYRLIGTITYLNTEFYLPEYIESNLGKPSNSIWYLSADKQSIIRSDNLIAEKQ